MIKISIRFKIDFIILVQSEFYKTYVLCISRNVKGIYHYEILNLHKLLLRNASLSK